ncbi:hypothetical protein [Streptomyces pinistramenti]|uniref:hypothetical protein n=1 Tax=Streptomyces pinistramenti TaxID=2884812 RepID=UPI001D05EF53|nr:hypothetical protein [Streptomyces pinistramenti]MCB5912255.1 hypothetical protein [Streptomyces pinistramenti]
MPAPRELGTRTSCRASATARSQNASSEDSRKRHSVYGFRHGHISALLAEERPDLDAELPAHLLIGALQNGPIVHLPA